MSLAFLPTVTDQGHLARGENSPPERGEKNGRGGGIPVCRYDRYFDFPQEYDSLMTEWQSAGRRLALEMSELKECTSLSGTLTPLGRLLTDPTLRRTSRDAEDAIAALEERAAPLLHVEHVR